MPIQRPKFTQFLLPSLLALSPACGGGSSGTGTDTSASGGDETGSTGEPMDCTLIGVDDVASDLTLPAGCYEAQVMLPIDGITLTMEPGVDMTFSPQAGLLVSGSGVLSVTGTAELPVLLHGTTEDRNAWQGIAFTNAASSSNRLEQVRVAHGSGVSVSAGSRLAVSAAEITGTDGFAIEAAEGAELTVATTLFEDNATPMSVGLSTVEGVASDNAFANNDDQFVLVTGQTVADPATWHAVGVPFHLANRIFVEAPLTLDPGVTVAVPQDLQIFVEPQGQLNAIGTAEAPITFTGVQAEPAFWAGIEVASNSSNNVFDNCVVEFAGSNDWFGGGDAAAAIYVPEDGKVTIRNSTIRQSGRYAVLATRGSDIAGFEGNAVTGNVRTMFVAANQGGNISADNQFVDNDEQVVRIGMGNTDRVDSDQTWVALTVPWRIVDRMLVDAAWTVAAGAVVEASQDVAILVEPGGSLHSAGTAAEPVLWTGADALAGFWSGISVRSTSSSNALDNSIVEYAGSSAWQGGVDQEAAIYVPTNGVLALTGTTIRDSAGHGVLLAGGSIDCSSVTFESIANDNVSGTGVSNCP